MGQISKLLRNATDADKKRDYLAFCCPGCKQFFQGNELHMTMMHRHQVIIRGPGAWGYNGNPDSPTFTPSVLVQTSYWDEKQQKSLPYVCHSFVENGRINFLNDCTHELRGWHDLVEWPYQPEIMET